MQSMQYYPGGASARPSASGMTTANHFAHFLVCASVARQRASGGGGIGEAAVRAGDAEVADERLVAGLSIYEKRAAAGSFDGRAVDVDDSDAPVRSGREGSGGSLVDGGLQRRAFGG